MTNTRNDDMDRKGNRSAPRGSAQGDRQGNLKGGPDSTSQGQGGNFNQGTTDPVNQDRAMNRDREMGQGSSGTEQGRQGFGNTGTGSIGTGSTGTGSTGTGSMGNTRDPELGNRGESGNRDRGSESARGTSNTGSDE